VNFLVADVPMAYKVIITRPTLSMVKAVIAPYLLLIQFELDDGRVGKLSGDQRMACKCYYVSLKLLKSKEETAVQESSRLCKLANKGAPEAVMMLSASVEDHRRPHLEPTTEVIEIPLDNSRLSAWFTLVMYLHLRSRWHLFSCYSNIRMCLPLNLQNCQVFLLMSYV